MSDATLKTPVVCVVVLLLGATAPVLAATGVFAPATPDPTVSPSDEVLRVRPLAFTENLGQWDERALFQAHMPGMTLWFTREGVTYQFFRKVEPSPDAATDAPEPAWNDRSAPANSRMEQLAFQSLFVGSNPEPEVYGEGLMEYRCNYFIGNDPTAWCTDVPNFQRVVYHDLYPGIDLAFYGSNGQIEYDFIVHPGADPDQILVRYDGVETSIDADGNLVLATAWGELHHRSPIIYQPTDGGLPQRIDGTFLASNTEAYGFALADIYDPVRALVIDPVLVYSTYFGGSDGGEIGEDIDVDNSGQAVVMMLASSSDLPTVNAYQDTVGSEFSDIFVVKFTSDGSSLIFGTYIGGAQSDDPRSMALDPDGNVCIVGEAPADFPLVNAIDNTFEAGSECFVLKLSAAGNALIFSTFLGGDGWEGARAVAVDDVGCAYVAGNTSSDDFPLVNAFETVNKFQFVTKFSPDGDSLVYSTYFGYAELYGIAVDQSGSAYVTGHSNVALSYPIKNAYQATHGGGMNDAVLTKFAPTGDSLIYSTYFGGTAQENAVAVDVDTAGNAYIMGNVFSGGAMPLVNPLQPTLSGGRDAFVAAFDASGSSLIYSTYLGGSGSEDAFDIRADAAGNAYVTGQTNSADFPLKNPVDDDYAGDLNDLDDVFITRISALGDSIEFSTYIGGTGPDRAGAVAVDPVCEDLIYATGYLFSGGLDTANPYQQYPSIGGDDAFVMKLNVSPGVDCDCPCPGDLECDGITIIDIGMLAQAVTCGGEPTYDPTCPRAREDVNCDNVIDLRDVIALVDYFLGSGTPICQPCDCVAGPVPPVCAHTDYPEPPSSCNPPGAVSGGSVLVESKEVELGATGVEIGIFVQNDVDLSVLALPLEIREVTSGAFMAGSYALTVQGRVGSSGLAPIGPVYSDTADAINSCSGPVSQTWSTCDSPAAPAAPADAAFWGGYQGFGGSCLSVGSDGAPGTGTPSFLLTFDVTGTSGTFEIDTACQGPGNHLLMQDCSTFEEIIPVFTKGVVTIGAPPACNASFADPYLLACPRGDIHFDVIVTDAVGDPIVGYSDVTLDFSDCDTLEFTPQPGVYPNWPIVDAPAPSDADGLISFAIAAGSDCPDCMVTVTAGCGFSTTVPVRSTDVDGDGCVTPADFDDALGLCRDLNADGVVNDLDVARHVEHCCDHCFPAGPCDWLGQDLDFDSECGLFPGDTVQLRWSLDNNVEGDTCDLDSVVFYRAQAAVTPVWERVGRLTLGLTLPPAGSLSDSLEYVLPPYKEICLKAELYSDCCDTVNVVLTCGAIGCQCPPSDQCFEFYTLRVNDADDTNWTFQPAELEALGWTVSVRDTINDSVSLDPDLTLVEICTSDITPVGTGGVVLLYFYFGGVPGPPISYTVEQNYFEGDICGGPNRTPDCKVDVFDVVCLVDFIFRSGPPPIPSENADINCDEVPDVFDIVTLVDFVFRNNDPPPDCHGGPGRL